MVDAVREVLAKYNVSYEAAMAYATRGSNAVMSRLRPAEFGRRRVVRRVRRVVRVIRKPPARLLKQCKRYRVKVTLRRGSKRVYKCTAVLKRQLRKKMRKLKRRWEKQGGFQYLKNQFSSALGGSFDLEKLPLLTRQIHEPKNVGLLGVHHIASIEREALLGRLLPPKRKRLGVNTPLRIGKHPVPQPGIPRGKNANGFHGESKFLTADFTDYYNRTHGRAQGPRRQGSRTVDCRR